MSLFAQTVSNPHKLVIRRLFDEVWTNADFSGLDEILAPRVDYHVRTETLVQIPEDLVRIVTNWKDAFPDLQFEVEGIVVERDQAAVRVVYRGTQAKEWKGIPAAERTVEVREMMFFRFDDERIAEVWEVADEHDLRRQLAGDS